MAPLLQNHSLPQLCVHFKSPKSLQHKTPSRQKGISIQWCNTQENFYFSLHQCEVPGYSVLQWIFVASATKWLLGENKNPGSPMYNLEPRCQFDQVQPDDGCPSAPPGVGSQLQHEMNNNNNDNNKHNHLRHKEGGLFEDHAAISCVHWLLIACFYDLVSSQWEVWHTHHMHSHLPSWPPDKVRYLL